MIKATINSFLATLLLLSFSIANAAQVGDLLISEVMANPSAVGDSAGEWFEVFNASNSDIDLNGLLLSDDGSNSHTVLSASPLLLSSGSYFVFGNNGDMATNGGLSVDYVYTGFTLSNSADQIVISDNLGELVRLDYSGAPFGNSGISAELTIQDSPLLSTHYVLTPSEALFQYGLGDFGTPGAAGSFALSAAPVPIPASIWLLAAALTILMRRWPKAYRTALRNRDAYA